jgi:hypothetical protein
MRGSVLAAFMNDTVMFKWFALTNVVMAVGPGILWCLLLRYAIC